MGFTFHLKKKKSTLCDYVCERVQYDEYLRSSFFWWLVKRGTVNF